MRHFAQGSEPLSQFNLIDDVMISGKLPISLVTKGEV
jgi:hypothetical protein